MKRNNGYTIEPVQKSDSTLELTRCVATIRRTRDKLAAGRIHRSYRNAPGIEPGLPTWWFCPEETGVPTVRSDVSEADILRLALAWLRDNE